MISTLGTSLSQHLWGNLSHLLCLAHSTSDKIQPWGPHQARAQTWGQGSNVRTDSAWTPFGLYCNSTSIPEIRITDSEIKLNRFNLIFNRRQIPESCSLSLQVYNFATVAPAHLIDWILMGHRKPKQMTNISHKCKHQGKQNRLLFTPPMLSSYSE